MPEVSEGTKTKLFFVLSLNHLKSGIQQRAHHWVSVS